MIMDGKTKEAFQLLDGAAKDDKDQYALKNSHVLRLQGHKLLMDGKLDLALQIFHFVAEMAPADPRSWLNLATTYLALK